MTVRRDGPLDGVTAEDSEATSSTEERDIKIDTYT